MINICKMQKYLPPEKKKKISMRTPRTHSSALDIILVMTSKPPDFMAQEEPHDSTESSPCIPGTKIQR